MLRSTLLTTCLAAALTACGSTTDPAPRGITELNGPPATLNVAKGFSVKSLIAIRRSADFEEVVNLTAEALPQGISVSFSPSSLTGDATLAEMTINTFAAVAPGTHSFTVRASSDGYESRTFTVTVNVTVPAIDVAASNMSPDLAQGETLSIPITVMREGGYTGVVGLAMIGLPAGVTATFTPTAVASGENTSTLELSAKLSASLSTTTITLRASAQGLPDRTVPLELAVVPATTPAILMTAIPPFLEVYVDSYAETELTIQRFGGFNGVVNVAISGLPDNLSATVVPIASGYNTATLRITAGSEQIAGRYDLTVRASGDGIGDTVAQIAVQTVQTPHYFVRFVAWMYSPMGHYLSYDTKSIDASVARNADTTLVMSVPRLAGHTAPVSLTVSGAPPGVMVTVPSIRTVGDTREFDVAVSATAEAAPGVYTISFTGDDGSKTDQATLTLTVRP